MSAGIVVPHVGDCLRSITSSVHGLNAPVLPVLPQPALLQVALAAASVEMVAARLV
jgi:hypothetical protein